MADRQNGGISLKSILRPVFIATLILLGAIGAMAQTYRGSVRGTVYDPNRAAIPGAQVSVTNLATGETRRASTGSDGEFAISALAPGDYRLSVEMRLFQKYEERIQLFVNQELRVDPNLVLSGPDVMQIDSTADAPLQ